MAVSFFKTACAVVVALQAWTAQGLQHRQDQRTQWVDIWGTMPQLVEPGNLPSSPFNISTAFVNGTDVLNVTSVMFENATLRQTIFITQCASTIRLVISNAYGATNLPISSATLALPLNSSAAGTSAIAPDSLARLTFSGGNSGVDIPNGARVVSDPIVFPVTAQQILTISLYLETGQVGKLITGHPGSRTNSFYTPGNATADADVAAINATQTSQHWYFISAVEGRLPLERGVGAMAIIGDSITDGRGSTPNSNNRWPDNLLRRLQQAPSDSSISPLLQNIALVNQAAGGNRVLADGLGPNALGRVDSDVLALSGVRYAMIFEGVNDIGVAAADAASQLAIGDALLAAFDQLVTLVHASGIPIFGATITPFGGVGQAYSNTTREATRQRVNAWIRDSGRFDAVVDFDAAVRNPVNVSELNPLYDSGDHLHLNPLGYQVMADAFDLSLFDKFADGVDVLV